MAEKEKKIHFYPLFCNNLENLSDRCKYSYLQSIYNIVERFCCCCCIDTNFRVRVKFSNASVCFIFQ